MKIGALSVGQRLWLGSDGWVSLEVSPLLAHDANSTIGAAARLHAQAACANILTKIPGTPEGMVAIEHSIFAGIPVDVTLLFSCDRYLAAAPDTLYVEVLAAEAMIDTIPEKTQLAFPDHGKLSAPLLTETSYAEDIFAKFRHEGLDDNALASRLQREGVGDFAKSWRTLLARIREKSHSVASAVSA